MKTIPVGLEANYASDPSVTLTLATCWKATLKDGTILGFTSHVEDLTIDGVTYEAATGHTPTSIETSSDLAVDNLEVEGLLNSPSITEADLLAGRWDHAKIELFEVNYENTALGSNKLRSGWLGEVRLGRAQFSAELRGLAQRLQQNIIELTSAQCRATTGDARCGLDLVALGYTTTGTVAAVDSNRQFTSNLSSQTVRLTPSTTGNPTDGYFDRGKVIWLTGLNAGLEMEIKTYVNGSPAAGEVELYLPMPYDVAPGDTFTAVAGDQKRLIEDCKNKFGNVVNFRGEPYKPTPNQMMRGPISTA